MKKYLGFLVVFAVMFSFVLKANAEEFGINDALNLGAPSTLDQEAQARAMAEEIQNMTPAERETFIKEMRAKAEAQRKEIEAKKRELKATMEGKREEMKETRDEVKGEIQEKRDAMKEKGEEMRKKARMMVLNGFTYKSENIFKVITKVESRIAKLKALGIEVGKAESALNSAKTSLEEAKTHMTEAKAVYDANGSLEDIKTHLQASKTAMQASHEYIKACMEAIKEVVKTKKGNTSVVQ